MNFKTAVYLQRYRDAYYTEVPGLPLDIITLSLDAVPQIYRQAALEQLKRCTQELAELGFLEIVVEMPDKAPIVRLLRP